MATTMCSIDEITLDKYLETLKNETKERTLLFGNGLGLSHPDAVVRRAFEFDGLRTSIDMQKFLCRWIFQSDPSTLGDLKNPEIFLQIIRHQTILEVLDGYMKNLKKNEYPNTYKIDQFLVHFTKVFSLNYDTLSYRIFSRFFDPSDKKRFSDDFRGKKSLRREKIQTNIESETNKFYFPHGAFHIMYESKSPEIYHKISINGHQFHKMLKSSIRTIIETLTNSDPKLTNTEKIPLPLLIFEDRPDVKKALIEKDDYLNLCYQALQKTSGHVFVFGCSFERDTHILEALFHPPCKKLYIAYREGDIKTKQNVINFLRKRLSQSTVDSDACNNICWVRVQPSEAHLLWTAFHTN